MDRGEMRLQYQPIMSLESGRLTGFEALVRWQHPVRGLLPPASFIGLAEETGLIVPLGEWIVRNAAEEATRWGSGLTVNANVSAGGRRGGDSRAPEPAAGTNSARDA